MKAPQLDFDKDSDHSSSSEAWDFVPIRSRRAAAARGSLKPVSPSTPADPGRVKLLISEVDSTMAHLSPLLERERFWDRYSLHFLNVIACEAYGIGSLDHSRLSLLQLSLFLLISQRLKVTKKVKFFDPAINDVDRKVLEHFHLAVNGPHNTDCTSCTLMYMPHCDRSLYEAVLWDRSERNPANRILSNFLTVYTLSYPTWDSLSPHFSEDAMFLYETDYDRWKAGRRSAKLGSRNYEIPFEAFNDLAFVHIRSDSDLHELLELRADWNRSLD